MNKVISSKAGYSKTRSTKLNKLDAGALSNMGVVKNAVSGFLGVGDKTYTNAKGKSEFMSTAGLKAADVKSASYTLSGGKYTYTLVLNNGSSYADSANKRIIRLLTGAESSSERAINPHSTTSAPQIFTQPSTIPTALRLSL